mgnify:CR=1 FL=1
MNEKVKIHSKWNGNANRSESRRTRNSKTKVIEKRLKNLKNPISRKQSKKNV